MRKVDIEANLALYLAARTPTDRYASFDYCFNYFQEHAERSRVAELMEGPALQSSCLQLGFYLASWGMYRGSSDLLRRSLAHLVPVIRVIATSPSEVWYVDANDYSDKACSLMLEVGARLKQTFPKGATDTPVTKIMLGVFGCVPAFDTYFKKSFGTWKFNDAALGMIARFYEENAEVIERHRVPTLDFATGLDTSRRYTRAKLIDMIFFTEGSR